MSAYNVPEAVLSIFLLSHLNCQNKPVELVFPSLNRPGG